MQQKVAEIMAERDALAFEPFFQSRKVAYELKRLQTVPEQRKFSVYFERYGCLVCETKARPHAGNGMCANCRSKVFVRLTQIIKEEIKQDPAWPARGATIADRRLPENAVRDGVHHAWMQRSTKEETLLYERVAKRLGVHPSHVRRVALDGKNSPAVTAAIEDERKALAPRQNG